MIQTAGRPVEYFRQALGILLACYWVALFVATHIPLPKVSELPKNSDKGMHVLAFGGLAFLLLVWLSASRPLTPFRVSKALAIAALYAGIDESLQKLLDYRTFDLYDLAANWMGLMIGLATFLAIRLFFARFWGQRAEKPKPPNPSS